MDEMKPHDKQALYAFALLRAGFACWLLWATLPHLDRSFIDHFAVQLDVALAGNPFPFYQVFLAKVALPNAVAIATVIPVAEVTIAAALLMGFLVRPMALLGLFYSLNLIFAVAHVSPTASGFSILMVLTFGALAIGDAGRIYGLDGWLFRAKEDAPPAKVRLKDKKQRDAVEKLARQLDKSPSKPKKAKKTKSPFNPVQSRTGYHKPPPGWVLCL